ncbi:hypothetical protein [Paenibacillus sp. MSJ-34]|uniref:hypothetical protein n=1 Tax=Paenibacillus sp. MSJ-34 TaxID=2841529 RepID=UPI001C113323|nr:hypothetical protein [Paenibacillus sp. MSJ-34]MBU5443072.1 hypothetical protein [Paenibacillus sp. MSJ-34]
MIKFKKIAMIATAIFLCISSAAAYATESATQSVQQKQVQTEEWSNAYPAPTVAESIHIPINTNFYNKETNKIDKDKLKQGIEELVAKNPKYAKLLDNLELKVDRFNANSENRLQSTSSISPQSVVIWYNDWAPGKEPRVTYDGNWYTYTISWLGEDNYRSSVPIKVSETKSITTRESIGFTGDADIKAKFGFSAAREVTQTATKTVGADIPAWTYWATRPYIYWNKKIYTGTWALEYIDEAGYHYIEEQKEGINSTQISKTNDYWTRTNSAKNPNANSPQPPDRMPY